MLSLTYQFLVEKDMLRLYEIRKSKGLTQKDVGDRIGVMNYTIGNWEQGRADPSVADLIALADMFECSVDYLIGRENDFGNVVVRSGLDQNQENILAMFSALSLDRQKIATSVLKDMLTAETK